MAERGIAFAHTTILQWVQRYVPECKKRWQRYARPVGPSWRVDETYIKIKGKRAYVYRSVDKDGHTAGLSAERTPRYGCGEAQALEKHEMPETVTLEGYAVSHRASGELQEEGVLLPKLIVGTSRS